MIISATITLADITAHADKDTFYTTTKDPAQVRGLQTRAQEARSLELHHSYEMARKLGTQHLTGY